MNPEQVFWWALAFIAADTALWVVTITVFSAVALFKPRGKVHPTVETIQSMPIEQIRAEVKSRRIVLRDRDPKVRS